MHCLLDRGVDPLPARAGDRCGSQVWLAPALEELPQAQREPARGPGVRCRCGIGRAARPEVGGVDTGGEQECAGAFNKLSAKGLDPLGPEIAQESNAAFLGWGPFEGGRGGARNVVQQVARTGVQGDGDT